MCDVRMVTDLDECERLWRRTMPRECVTDLWEVRECCHRHYQRPVCFIVAEDARGIRGLLPLSWIEESGCYGFFPGETWHGKTWLEQNRIGVSGDGVLRDLLAACPGPYSLRYLLPRDFPPEAPCVVDEIGYLFVPSKYGFDMADYFSQEFSSKSAKRLRGDLASIEARGVRYRLDDLADFDHILRLNLDRFGEESYFADVRFRESFRSLASFLESRGWLRMTTVLIDGQIAAVDMGCLFRGVYTLLAGGTHAGCPGVAKLINTYHMRRACEERFRHVDFLCGDFSWKTLFHLTPSPLYLLSNATPAVQQDGEERSVPIVR